MKKLLLLSLVSVCLLHACKESDQSYLESPNTKSSTTATSNGSWIRKADFKFSRSYSVGFSIGNKGYMGIGGNEEGTSFLDFWEYDPVSDSWTQKANFAGVDRTASVGFSIGNMGYIGIGYNGENRGTNLKDFWQYNPVTNCWTRKADFKGVARHSAVGLSIGSKGYIGTGLDSITDMRDFWEYNPETNSWVQKADFPGRARSRATGFTIGNKGYLGTGYSAGLGTNEDHKDFWEYNPDTDSWEKKADFGGFERQDATSFSIDGFGYIGTGYGNSGKFLKDLWEYNPLSDSWVQKSDLPGEPRLAATGLSIGTKGYIGFGTDNNKDFWQFSRD